MIGSGTLTKQIAGYLPRTGFDALDGDALRATKEHTLYTLGTILAGSSAPGIKQALAGARALSGASQESTVLVTGDKLPAASVALVNATMGTAASSTSTTTVSLTSRASRSSRRH